MKLDRTRVLLVLIAVATSVAMSAAIALGSPSSGAKVSPASEQGPDQVLEWNQIFIETLIATNTPNSSSQRLGAIVHTAIFDAFNGIAPRYTPIFVPERRRQRKHPGSPRSVAPSSGHCCRVYGAGGPVSLTGDTAERQLRGLARGAQRRRPRRRTSTGARHCLGHTRRAVRTRLARSRWLQRELPALHRRNDGRPVAPDPARHVDERARLGVHRAVRRRKQHSVPA